MVRIEDGEFQRIGKHRHRFDELDAVFLGVRSSLAGIPLDSTSRVYPAGVSSIGRPNVMPLSRERRPTTILIQLPSPAPLVGCSGC
jgi:hypothetical protein